MLLWEQARQDAEQVRRMCNVTSFPVDVEEVIDKIGLEVKFAPLDEGTSGFIIKRDHFSGPEIYIESSEPAVRQRFTMAHELGHYFDRAHADDEEYSFIDRRGSDHYDLTEFYADEFAGNLLMPESEIDRLQAEGVSSPVMAIHFGVSHPAMKRRLTRLDKIREIEETRTKAPAE